MSSEKGRAVRLNPLGADGVHELHTGVHADEYAAGRIVFFSEAIAKRFAQQLCRCGEDA
jgi:hypothetical protein